MLGPEHQTVVAIADILANFPEMVFCTRPTATGRCVEIALMQSDGFRLEGLSRFLDVQADLKISRKHHA